jgi:hypothetical protein
MRFHVLQQCAALGDHVRAQRRRIAADVRAQPQNLVAHAHPVLAGARTSRQRREHASLQLRTFGGHPPDPLDAQVLPGLVPAVFGLQILIELDGGVPGRRAARAGSDE